MSGWVAGSAALYTVSSLVKANAAKQAAAGQAAAGEAATRRSDAQAAQSRADQMPWMKAGQTAIGQLSDLTKAGGDLNRHFTLDDFVKDPGYDFRMSEGSKAIERSAAARGGVLGGGTLKSLTQYNQNFASNEYGNSYSRWNNDNTNTFNRLASIAGVGQTAANANQQGGQFATNQMQGNTWGSANAIAAGTVAAGQQYGNAINSIGKWAGSYSNG